ncbi:MAG: UDP-N-acetylmuramoylalanyl-D-glutamyl-2,6-diaminopimelate--D-alanyl-D-alanine ligase [Alphaproteobacteria bacterium]
MVELSLWSSQEIIDATGGTLSGDAFDVSGVSIDSRTVGAGDLFIAIKGPNHDGHDFARAAAEKGAALLLDRAIDGLPDGACSIIVDDTFSALNDLGHAARARTNADIVAITGSVGKTGTKELLAAVLSQHGKTHCPVGSFNNHWGVPLTLARMPRDAQFGVFEIGMNHAGEIAPLAKMVKPRLVIITTIAGVHMANFDHIDDIARAKAEIFQGLVPGGMAVLPFDNAFFGILTDYALSFGASNVVSFGEGAKSAVKLEKVSYHPDCSCARARVLGQDVTFKIGMPGHHWVTNALAVLAATQLLTGELGQAGIALAGMVPPKGRGAHHTLNFKGGALQLVDESYNASPPSMRAALEILAAQPVGRQGRRVAVLGDMLELGDETVSAHEALAAPIDKAGVDRVYLVGAAVKSLAAKLGRERLALCVENTKELQSRLERDLRAGDVVMLKGSNGIGLSRIVDHFIDAYPAQTPSDELL